MSVVYSDLCGCTGITSSRGEKGDTGATGATGATGSTGAAGAMPTTYSFQQAYASSNDIYNGGSGYNYAVSASLPAGTKVYCNITIVVSATDSHTVTAYPIINGAVVTTYQYVNFVPAAGGTGDATLSYSFAGTYTAGQTLDFHIQSDGAAVTARLKTVTGYYYTTT